MGRLELGTVSVPLPTFYLSLSLSLHRLQNGTEDHELGLHPGHLALATDSGSNDEGAPACPTTTVGDIAAGKCRQLLQLTSNSQVAEDRKDSEGAIND